MWQHGIDVGVGDRFYGLAFPGTAPAAVQSRNRGQSVKHRRRQ